MLMQIFGDKQGALWDMGNWSSTSNQFSGLLASSPGCFGGGAKPASWLRTNFSTTVFQTFQTEVLKVSWSNVFWLNKPVPLSK